MSHSFDMRVYYEDTDMAGIVYYANYLRFLERGRSEAVREAGFDQMDMRDRLGLVFAVTRVEIDYLKPARFDDVLTVKTATSKVGAASMTMTQDIFRKKTHLIHADIKIVLMSLSGKPKRFQEDMRSMLLDLQG